MRLDKKYQITTQQKQAVRERQQDRCRCGEPIEQVHHINSKRWGNSDRNLVGLCLQHHAAEHPTKFYKILSFPERMKAHRWKRKW